MATPHRASRYHQRFYWILAHVRVDSVTFTRSTSQPPSPELGSLASSFGARR